MSRETWHHFNPSGRCTCGAEALEHTIHIDDGVAVNHILRCTGCERTAWAEDPDGAKSSEAITAGLMACIQLGIVCSR